MRASITNSGSNTFFCNMYFDKDEEDHVKKIVQGECRFDVRGNAAEGIILKIDSFGRHKLNRNDGNPNHSSFVRLPCSDQHNLGFVKQKISQQGLISQILPNGWIKVLFPEHMVSPSLRARPIARGVIKYPAADAALPIVMPPATPTASARGELDKSIFKRLAEAKDLANLAIDDINQVAVEAKEAGLDVQLALEGGKLKLKLTQTVVQSIDL